MLNLSRTYSSKDIVYNTDMGNIFNAFSGLESQRLSLGGLTITPSTDSTTAFKVTNAAGTQQFAVSTTTGNAVIAGFTTLGDASIKVKKLTGTTGSTEGDTTNIAHGLTGAKILDVRVKIEYATNTGLYTNHHLVGAAVGYDYDWYSDATNIVVALHGTSSENILSKNIIVLVFYEA